MDSRRGFTIEFANDPTTHSIEYDEEEARLLKERDARWPAQSEGAGEARAYERGVREACRLMRHVDTLDKVPGARDGLPHLNPLWDGSVYVEDALVGPFADRIQRPAQTEQGEDA